jgi:3-phenylpropionate/trans-cinnamate dioxygenase ferredoxin reductase subunit
MAGLSGGYDQLVTRGETESRKFSVIYFRNRRLAAVDSVNHPGEHLAARKLIGAGTEITPEQAADLSVDLKSFQ